MKWHSRKAVGVALAAALAVGGYTASAQGKNTQPTSGVGSCTLKGWNPGDDPADAKDLPQGSRPQAYKRDDYNCSNAILAPEGAEFTKFPQPRDYQLVNTPTQVKVGSQTQTIQTARTALAPAGTAATNPTAPYFPPFKHFVLLYRENHTFDDYLGDCATTIHAGCNGQVQSTNHISSVPNLHTLAKTYGLDDAYSTGVQPPSGPNHWFMFSGQSASSSQQQAYPGTTGTMFDRFLNGVSSSSLGTDPCNIPANPTTTGTPNHTFLTEGDFYWMLSTGSGEWSNPGTGKPEVLPVNRPGTTIPETLDYNNYTCKAQNDDDGVIANNFVNAVSANGLPDYSYVELFNDHPGTYQDIPKNDSSTNQIVNSIMTNPTYKDNTLIVVTEDDTQNGNNGADHVSNTYRVPLVVIGSPTYVKQNYLSHVAYNTSNVIAAMERVMENVKPGTIDPNNSLGLHTFPMTTADQSALGDPLEDFWVQGSTPLSATASGTPTSGNAPLSVAFTGTATGGTAPYTYSWNFGDGTTSTTQNPSHTYSAAGNYTATLTVTDSSGTPQTAASSVAITVAAVGSPLSATASSNTQSGQTPLTVNFTGSASGGTPPYSYSWNFGDGSAASTAQNPSHTYNNAGDYTATLTVTDASSPAKTATSTLAIHADPIAGTAPGAPTGLTATAGTGQITLNWTAPANSGGVNITSYKVYRSTTPGGEAVLTTGGCSGLGNVLTCTDSGLTSGQTYYYKVSAVNAIGEGAQSTEASATTPNVCTGSGQLLGNPGFESGNTVWSATSGVITNNTAEPARTGSWKAWLDGYGTTHTDTLSQSVTLPSGCSTYQFNFWMHIDTAETTTTTKYDTLKLQVLNSAGTVLGNLYTYSNLNHNTGYSSHTFNLSAYAGQTITLKFTGTEDSIDQTSFVIDDAAVNVS